MLNIGWGEFLIIGMVALIFIGPKELPGLLRSVGQWTTKLRRMAAEFQGQFHEAMREAEMAELKKEVDDLTAQAKSYADFDPIGEVRRDLEHTHHQIESAVAGEPVGPSSTVAVATETASVATEGELKRESEVAAAASVPASAPGSSDLDAAGAPTEPSKDAAEGKPA
jgi:sec-independent protein translocase protein TatB